MTLIADASVPDPVVRALQAVQFDIARIGDIASGAITDRAVAELGLASGGILVTFDLGPGSQAYTSELVENGLTVVALTWQTSTPLAWQQMVDTILRKAETWIEAARAGPSLIAVSYAGGSRARSGLRLAGRLMAKSQDESPATHLQLPLDLL